tara:strand:- start:138 stop:620 length:483 start_codon:yes stop_codon:yes gene_type:complete
MRIGQGFDAHQLKEGIPLIIGGVSIPFSKGSKGHSDGDVLYHAMVDAMLGSLALGDIGGHFPSENNKWKNADSNEFVSYSLSLIREKGYFIVNLDATIILQMPKINAFIPQMRSNIAEILEMEIACISVKATTTDEMGFTGQGKGLAAQVVLLIQRINDY